MGGAGIIRLKANIIHIYLPTGTELGNILPKDYHLARMLPTGHIYGQLQAASLLSRGWVGVVIIKVKANLSSTSH